jgi:acyl dehydratase
MPDTPRPHYLEDFVPGEAHLSPPHTVTEEEALDFAHRYDPQTFHTDPVKARESMFGELVCGGFQTAALAWRMALDSRLFDQCPIAGIGVDELRWWHPVKPGDVLRCRFTLLDARPSGSRADRGVARFRLEVLDAGERVVMSMVLIQLLRRRPGDQRAAIQASKSSGAIGRANR